MHNIKLPSIARIFANISYIKRPACPNPATIMICCKLCHTQIYHICATIWWWRTHNLSMWKFWTNRTRIIQILHFISLCMLFFFVFFFFPRIDWVLWTFFSFFFKFHSILTAAFLICGLFGTILEHLINFDVKINLSQLQRRDAMKY